jgi:hypothetical protein
MAAGIAAIALLVAGAIAWGRVLQAVKAPIPTSESTAPQPAGPPSAGECAALVAALAASPDQRLAPEGAARLRRCRAGR